MCYWQLLGLAGSYRLIVLLVCVVLRLFEVLNDGLHASTHQCTNLHMACKHQQGSEEIHSMSHNSAVDCY